MRLQPSTFQFPLTAATQHSFLRLANVLGYMARESV
jgi:hypothetical protein